MFENEEKGFIDSHRVFDILNQYNINQREISNLVRGKICEKQYLNQLLNSSIDVDQLDYIIRDSYYTGVAFGLIDIERYLQTLVLHDENLAIMRKGVGVVENILMARTLMYSSVYFHKTVRIAELMLSKAIEMIDNAEAFEFFKMTDAELINYLRNRGDFQREIATRLKYRKLFKQGYVESGIGLAEGKLEIIKKLDDARFRRKKEQEFEETLSIPRGHVIIDVPYTELHLSEPRIDQTNILIIDGNRTKTLDEYTPVGNAVKSRVIPDWIIMIITDDKYRAIVADKAERILFE
jgi:HD superfamily phosphohydrolase